MRTFLSCTITRFLKCPEFHVEVMQLGSPSDARRRRLLTGGVSVSRDTQGINILDLDNENTRYAAQRREHKFPFVTVEKEEDIKYLGRVRRSYNRLSPLNDNTSEHQCPNKCTYICNETYPPSTTIA
ncbi:hypothetical protein CBL_01264 [Carabus blaptoides fortunei]